MLPNVSEEPAVYNIRVQRRRLSEPFQETPDLTPGALRVSNLKMATDYSLVSTGTCLWSRVTCTRVKNVSATVRMHANTEVSHIIINNQLDATITVY